MPAPHSYVRQLEMYRHDIAERYYCVMRLVDELLTDDPEGQELLMSCHSKANAVKILYKVIDYCLQSEVRAERFFKVFQETNPHLHADLLECGPRGKSGTLSTLTQPMHTTQPDTGHHLFISPLCLCYSQSGAT